MAVGRSVPTRQMGPGPGTDNRSPIGINTASTGYRNIRDEVSFSRHSRPRYPWASVVPGGRPPLARHPPIYLTGAGFTPVSSRWPASTGMVTPVTEAARSELRYSAVSAMTCGGMNVVPLRAWKW